MNPFPNPGDLAHVHLLLNHAPTLGSVIAFALLLLAALRKSDDLTSFSLQMLYVIAILALPVYMSGAAAHAVLKDQPGVSEPIIAAHQSAAIVALVCSQLTGVVAWFVLWRFRRDGGWPRLALTAVWVLSLAGLATMAWAANIGGHIRHPEIALGTVDTAAQSGLAWLDAPAFGNWTLNRLWMWPTGETLHFLGMSLSFGMLLVLNLHVLGFMPSVPFRTVHRLLPWGILGLSLNVISGMVFFNAVADQYLENPTFYWKVILLMLAGFAYLYLTVYDRPWRTPAAAPLTDRLIAVSSLVLWVGALYLGRMLPYLRGKF